MKNKDIKAKLYEYIKCTNDNDRQSIINSVSEHDKSYFTSASSYGIFGCHSTSTVESYNNIIKKNLKQKRSRNDKVLEVLENLYAKQLEKIENIIETKNNNNDLFNMLWPECYENMSNQLYILYTAKYDSYYSDEMYNLLDNDKIFYIKNLPNGLFCSCKFKDITGILCSHLLFIKIKYNFEGDLICNEAYKTFFYNNKISNYYINFKYPEDLISINKLQVNDIKKSSEKENNQEIIINRDEFEKIQRIVSEIYKTDMLNEILYENINIIYNNLLKLLYKDLCSDEFISFSINDYKNICDKTKVRIITYIFILSKKCNIVNDPILSYIENERSKRIIKIQPRIKNKSENVKRIKRKSVDNNLIFEDNIHTIENSILINFIDFSKELTTSNFNKLIDIFNIKSTCIMDPILIQCESKIDIYQYKYIPICLYRHWSLIFNNNKTLIHYDSLGCHFCRNDIYSKFNLTFEDIIQRNLKNQKKFTTCGFFVIYIIMSLEENKYFDVLDDENVIKIINEKITRLYEANKERVTAIITKESIYY